MPQSEPSFERHGGNNAEKTKTEETITENRKLQERDLAEFEISKTEADRTIINQVEEAVDAEVRRYGGYPSRIPPDRVHLVRPGSLRSLQSGRFGGGFAALVEEYAVVERSPSDSAFAAHLAHELFHIKSPKVVKPLDTGDKPRLHRSGLVTTEVKNTEIVPGYERKHFAELEEAIVAEATDRVFHELITTNESVATETALFERITPWLRKLWAKTERPVGEGEEMIKAFRAIPAKDAKEILTVLEGDELTEDGKLIFLYDKLRKIRDAGAAYEAERTYERAKLDRLIDDLVVRYNEQVTHDQIMAKFLEANFTGNYLGIARMIERVMGKGAFRRVAEDFGGFQ